MYEIERLRTRLRNVQRNVTEYRMTVSEAKELLKEIDILLKPKEISKETPPEVVVNEPATITRIIDGGAF